MLLSDEEEPPRKLLSCWLLEDEEEEEPPRKLVSMGNGDGDVSVMVASWWTALSQVAVVVMPWRSGR